MADTRSIITMHYQCILDWSLAAPCILRPETTLGLFLSMSKAQLLEKEKVTPVEPKEKFQGLKSLLLASMDREKDESKKQESSADDFILSEAQVTKFRDISLPY